MLRPVMALATAANAARSGDGRVRGGLVEELLVVDVEVGREGLLVTGGELRRAQVLRGCAHLEVDGLLELAVVVVRRASRGAVVSACKALRPALGLALLGALSLLGHRAA
jgi:hypothetical protein